MQARLRENLMMCGVDPTPVDPTPLTMCMWSLTLCDSRALREPSWGPVMHG